MTMSERKLGFDSSLLEGKIVEDDKFLIAKDAVIASEIVQKYSDGYAYKSADELEKAAWTFDHRWVKILSHPDTRILQRAGDIHGRVENPHFVKDLKEPKTGRPCRRGIRADIKWFKEKVPLDIQEKIKSGELKDVSIGFTFDMVKEPGEWNGQHYDYKQTNIFGDHLAAPVEAGRCPGPICGISVDSLFVIDKYSSVEDLPEQVKMLPVEGQNMFLEVFNSAWKQYNGDEGKCMATAWATIEKKYVKDAEGKWTVKANDCPLCRKLDEMGSEDFMKALIVNIGKDMVFKAVGLDIEEKKEGNKSKPKDYETIPDNEFADPVNYKYPIDATHVEAAWAYWSKPENQSKGGYNDAEWSLMGSRITAAMKKHGHHVAEEGGKPHDAVDTVSANRTAIAEARLVFLNIFS
jgi:cation transport regulator ChaB